MFSNDTGLFKKAKESKYLPNIILAILISIMFLVVGQLVGGIIEVIFLISTNSSPSIKFLVQLIAEFIFISLGVFMWVRFVENRKVSTIGFCREKFLKKYVVGFITGFLMLSLVVGLLFITGSAELSKDTNTTIGLSALSSVLIVLPGWIIQSGTEEVLTRGWLMNVIGARYNVPLAIGVSSSLFGALHLLNPNVSVIAIVNIVLVGVFFGLYMIKTGNLWGTCGLHAAWNWCQGNIFGLEVSGESTGIGTLMKVNLTGSKLFTGGEFGPEAGIVSTIVLLAGIVIVLVLMKKEKDHI